ncbi:MFS transporter [Ramlibacter sp. PS4R-6]|uniref:MFS transporter n=1 Tax=Ramlibacter sp. PS4R-6 TaxID=3133438 RepID=UPI0030B7742F
MTAHRLDPALVVVAGGVAAALHVGKLPTAIPVLRDALHITLVQAGFLLSLVQFAGMVLGLAVGLAADALGLRRTMAQGLALLAAASALGALAQDAATLMALRAVEGLGFLLASMPAPSLIRRLVEPRRVNAALGWWGAYMPLGTALALVAGPLVMAAIDWRGWWAVLAVVAGAMSAVVAWALPASANEGAVAARPWAARLRTTLRAPGPWLVALCFGVYSAQWLSLIGFLPTVYAQAGVAATWAGAATALVAVVNMAGNVVAGRWLQRGAKPQRLLAAGFVAMAVGAVFAFAEVAAPLRYAGALLFSMLGGLIPGTLFSLGVRLAPGEETVSTTVGWMQQWSAFGQFAGPPIVAAVASAVGGWQWSGAVTAAFATAGLCIAALIARQPARAH